MKKTKVEKMSFEKTEIRTRCEHDERLTAHRRVREENEGEEMEG